MQKITVYTDGASRGNPGPASIAYVINGLAETIEYYSPIGSTTNNQAEYQAMKAALERLLVAGVQGSAIMCYSDSELMVKQINGIYRVKDQQLLPHFQAIVSSIAKLKRKNNSIEFIAVRREENKRADYLANCALDNTSA